MVYWQVVLKPSAQDTTEEDIISFLKTKVAAFKVPTKLFICTDFPRTATGKIQRRHVATHFMEKKEG